MHDDDLSMVLLILDTICGDDGIVLEGDDDGGGG